MRKTLTPLTVAALLLTMVAFRSEQKTQVIELPITLLDGFGPFPVGFGFLSNKPMDPDNPWIKTELHTTGTPADWTGAATRNIWFDGRQFAYQNLKQGSLDPEFFEELRTSWNINLAKRPFSSAPIRCYVHITFGKNKNGELRYKIDSNNNHDFADDPEKIPVKFDWAKRDSLADCCADHITYETFRNGKVVKTTAPVLIVEHNGGLMRTIPQHAKATVGNAVILINSQGFASTDYEPAAICLDANDVNSTEIIEEREFIRLDNRTYKHMGVNTDKMVLMLKPAPEDTIIYSTQVGFMAVPFKGSEFSTREEISLASYRGKFLYLEFWGSWCGPCIQELPHLKRAYRELDPSRIAFLGVARDEPEALRKMLEKQQIAWKQLQFQEEAGMIDDYNIQGYPTSFLIDPTGKIIAKNLRGEYLVDSLARFINR